MRRALISVYDKTGIVDFAKSLVDLDWEIISTGGTEKILKEEGLDVLSVEEITGTKEILGGRVKTLHPIIYGGILNRRENEQDQLDIEELNIHSIDMVVNNLYPFEEVVLDPASSEDDAIENIDIGGPSMIRAAAKNYRDVIVVTDPKDYHRVIEALKIDGPTDKQRQQLATKAFSLTAFYDAMISRTFAEESDDLFNDYLVQGYRYEEELRYGENPHQEATYYSNPLDADYQIEQRHGKQLSYNNYSDMKSCIELVTEFQEPAAVAIKHNNPCGVGIGGTLVEAYTKAFESDPISIFGGIVGLNREVDLETAEKLSEIFLEIVIAPAFSDKALEKLKEKKNIRLIEVPNLLTFTDKSLTSKEAIGGLLVQERDRELFSENGFECVSPRQPNDAEQEDLIFAWKVAKHINSNGIVLAKNGQTIGIGQGEVRRIWALENAIDHSEFPVEGAVAASDGFFFEDTVETLHEHGIQAVIQPGGSVKDEKVIEAARKYDVTVIFTGMRHFRH